MPNKFHHQDLMDQGNTALTNKDYRKAAYFFYNAWMNGSFTAGKLFKRELIQKVNEETSIDQESSKDFDDLFNLSLCYLGGIGIPNNDTKAVDLLFKLLSIMQDDPHTDNGRMSSVQNLLGFMYDRGRIINGLTQAENDQKAVFYYTSAAEHGNPAAQNNLAIMYQDNRVANKTPLENKREAIRLYTEAANQGFAMAQYNLGLRYEMGSIANNKTQKENDEEAANLYSSASKQGYALAQNVFARMHENHRVADLTPLQSEKEAVRLYAAASVQGHSIATVNLVDIHEKIAKRKRAERAVATQKSPEKAMELEAKFEKPASVPQSPCSAISSVGIFARNVVDEDHGYTFIKNVEGNYRNKTTSYSMTTNDKSKTIQKFQYSEHEEEEYGYDGYGVLEHHYSSSNSSQIVFNTQEAAIQFQEQLRTRIRDNNFQKVGTSFLFSSSFPFQEAISLIYELDLCPEEALSDFNKKHDSLSLFFFLGNKSRSKEPNQAGKTALDLASGSNKRHINNIQPLSSMFYQFMTQNGACITYPVAAYAAVQASKWVEVETIERWLKRQKQPIPYEEVLSFFEEVKQSASKPKIFDINFRAMTQLLALLTKPVSAQEMRTIVPEAYEIRDSVYGCTLRINPRDRQVLTNTIHKNGFIVSECSSCAEYPEQLIMYVIGAAVFSSPEPAHYNAPDAMQRYWQERNQLANQRPVLFMPLAAPVEEAVEQKHEEREQEARQAPLHASVRQLRQESPSVALRPFFNQNVPWIPDFNKIAHTGITREELLEEVQRAKAESAFFDPSISLSVAMQISVTRLRFYTYIALGADPNHQDFFQRTMLRNAVKYSRANLEHVSWLLDVGADPDIPDDKGESARDLAKKQNLSEVCAMFDALPKRTAKI